MIDKNTLLNELKKSMPEFSESEPFDELLYVDYGRFGSFLHDKIKFLNVSENLALVKKSLEFLNDLYQNYGEDVENLIEVSIFEIVIEVQFGYEIAEIYFSPALNKLFLEKFPYEQFKDSWDTEAYYSKKEFEAILRQLE